MLRARREAHGSADDMATKLVCFFPFDDDGALNSRVSERASNCCESCFCFRFHFSFDFMDSLDRSLALSFNPQGPGTFNATIYFF